MQQNYYQILGIHQEATERELRRAYRLLAVKYHPDSSQIPDAHQYFVKINEAYQTLNDPLKRRKYDLKLDFHKNTSFTYDANVAQPYYKDTYRPPTTPKEPEKEKDLERFVPYIRSTSILACLFVCLLVFDFFLIRPTDVRQVKKILLAEGPGGEISTRIIGEKADKSIDRVIVDIEKVEQIDAGDYYKLHISPIFNIIDKIEIVSYDITEEGYSALSSFRPHYGIFNVFAFFLILLLGSGVCGLVFSRDQVGLLFNFGLLNILLIIITTVITYNS